MKFTEHMRAAMKNKKVSAISLSNKLGVSRQRIYDLMHRDKAQLNGPTWAIAERIADALDCDIVLIDRHTGERY